MIVLSLVNSVSEAKVMGRPGREAFSRTVSKFAFPAMVPTLQPQTPLMMLQTRYFFGFYYFYAIA